MQKSVLIVEDEHPLRDILVKKLHKENLNILQAGNGREGLALASEHHPDLILLDIVMPVMDGITMLTQLREDEWGKNAQVILLTNLSEGEEVAKALELATYEYLVKSDWSIDDIAKKVWEKLAIE